MKLRSSNCINHNVQYSPRHGEVYDYCWAGCQPSAVSSEALEEHDTGCCLPSLTIHSPYHAIQHFSSLPFYIWQLDTFASTLSSPPSMSHRGNGLDTESWSINLSITKMSHAKYTRYNSELGKTMATYILSRQKNETNFAYVT